MILILSESLQYDGKVSHRINEHQVSLSEKRAVREKAK